MKKIFRLLFIIGFIISFSGCFNDKGNYDYSIIPEIHISSQDTIYVTQFEELKVSLNLDLDGLTKDDYDFEWRLWSNDIEQSVRKHISDEQELKYQVTEMPMDYTLIVTLQNKKTQVKTYKEIKVIVQGVISEGWMVLHEKNGKTDFDLIMTPYLATRFSKETILTNLYESINEEPLSGRGVKIANYFALGRYQYVVVLTEDGGVRLSATSLQKLYDLPTLMLDNKPMKPENYLFYPYYWCKGYYNEALISDGRFYINVLLGNGFVEPIAKNGETYKPSKWLPRWIEYFKGMFYDDLNGRFLGVSENQPLLTIVELPEAMGRLFDWNNMNATMLYMETGFNNYEYAVMEDWTTHKHILYVLNFDDLRNNFDVAYYHTDDCPEFTNAKYFSLGERGPVFYYATDKDIYLYDFAGTNTAQKVLSIGDGNLGEAGEKISQIKIFKACTHRFINSHPYDNKALIISTYNETSKEGKVYMFYINEANGTIDLSSKRVYSGFGEIIDMAYNFPKYG